MTASPGTSRTPGATMPGADQVQQAVEELLAAHDPKTTDRRTFLEARFDAGLAWVHYPPGAGGLGLDAQVSLTAGDPRHLFLRTRANSIEGGTSEVLRNILAERVLGLPGDPRVDRDLPWRDVPRS